MYQMVELSIIIDHADGEHSSIYIYDKWNIKPDQLYPLIVSKIFFESDPVKNPLRRP